METVKVRLLKRHNGKPAGELIEVRPGDAKILKAVGVVEDYVAPARRTTTATRVMQPETIQSSSTISAPPTIESVETKVSSNSPSETDLGDSDGFGSEGYNRRDMRPQE